MLNRSQFIPKVEEALNVINESITTADTLVTYICGEVTDRVSFYLNCGDEFDERLITIVARIANGIYTQTKTNLSGTSDDREVKSMTDNGQSITFGEGTKNYLATVSDNELFSGFSELLKPYRRLNVVYPKCKE